MNKEAIEQRLVGELEKSAALGEVIGFLRGRVDKKEGKPIFSSMVTNAVLGAGAEAGLAYGGTKLADKLMRFLGQAPMDKRTAILMAILFGGLGAIAGTGVARSIVAGPPVQPQPQVPQYVGSSNQS